MTSVTDTGDSGIAAAVGNIRNVFNNTMGMGDTDLFLTCRIMRHSGR